MSKTRRRLSPSRMPIARRLPAGAIWRILAHGGGKSVVLYSSDYPEHTMRDGPGKPFRRVGPKIPRAERVPHRSVFDELVLDDLIHVEQMSARHWWILVGGILHVNVSKTAKGKITVSFWEDRGGGVSGKMEGRRRGE